MQIIGFKDNKDWFYLNNPGATRNDVLMSEDGAVWFKKNGMISEDPIFDEHYSYCTSLETWVDDMMSFGIKYAPVGHCENYGHALEML